MREIGAELVVELLSTVVYVVAAGLLTIGGTIAEYNSLQYFGTGEQFVALWLAAIGAILLYAGVYRLGYEKVLAQFV